MATVAVTQNLTTRLDRLPMGGFHWKLLALSGLGWMFDAMDILVVASVAAAAALQWAPGTAAEALRTRADIVAMVTSANTAGLFFGALVSGWLADRFGRKSVFQLTLLVYSLCTGLSALAPTPETLAATRFLAGLGLGGELPVASALISEFAPASRRGFMVVLLESFWAYGAVLAALIGFVVIGQLGLSWRVAFLIGTLPALYVFVLRRGLPESPRLLASQGRVAEAEAVVSRLERDAGVPTEKDGTDAVSPGAGLASTAPRARIAALFSPAYRRRTLVLWVMWATINFSYYGIFLWLPSLLASQGLGLVRSLQYNLIITLAQIPGYFSAALLVERLGRRLTLALYLVLAGVGAYFFGQTGLTSQNEASLLLWGSVISFFNLGAWGVVYTYTPELYPTSIRGTGAGWAAAFGRLFAYIAPASVPALIALVGRQDQGVFLVFMAVMLFGGLVVLALGPETQGRTLEEVAGV